MNKLNKQNKINKKGDHKELLVDLAVVVGVVVLIFAIVMILSKKGDESTQDILCRASVITRGKASGALVKGLVEFEKITPLACHTTDLGKLKGSREDVKRQIAQFSSKCWWEFAEGSVADIFKVDKKEKACFVCYTFSIGDNLDKGIASRTQTFSEPAVNERTSTNISSYEMTNYLVSESYNPGIIYGGGTKNYFGQEYRYGLDAGIGNEPRTIKPSKIKSTLVNGYVMDYSYMINDDTKNKINEIGVKLQQAGAGNLLVIAAEQFSSMENSDARQIIENTGLNSNDTNYDAILVMLDLKKQTMRIQLGSDQSIFIKEYELQDIMEKKFADAAKSCQSKTDTKCNLNAVNKALLDSITEVSDKLTNSANQLEGISPKSYYYYLTNGGYTWTMMTDITYPQRYAITYVAVSDSTGWKPTKVLTVAGAGLGVIVGVVLTATGVGAVIGTPMLIAGSAAIAGTGAYAGYNTGQAINDISIRPNNIMIVPVNSLGDQCTMVK